MLENPGKLFAESALLFRRSLERDAVPEIPLLGGYDHLSLPAEEHKKAVACIRKIRGPAYAHVPLEELPEIYIKKGRAYIAEGPILYDHVTQTPFYVIYNGEWSCISNPENFGIKLLPFPRGTVPVDLGVGGGKKFAEMLRLTHYLEQKELKEIKESKRSKRSKTAHQVPRVMAVVDGSRSNLEQSLKIIGFVLSELGLTYQALWGDDFKRPSSRITKPKEDVSIILLEQNYMEKNFFDPEQTLQQMVGEALRNHGIEDCEYRVQICGGMLNNSALELIHSLIGNMSQLFQPPSIGREKGRGRLIAGLDYGTDVSTSRLSYDTPEFKIWAAMDYYRQALRLGYKPFDISAYDITLETSGNIDYLRKQDSLCHLDWSSLSDPERSGHDIRAEFCSQQAVIVEPKPGNDLKTLDLRHVHTESITRFDPLIWQMVFESKGMRIGNSISAKPQIKADGFAPHYAFAEYYKFKRPAPSG